MYLCLFIYCFFREEQRPPRVEQQLSVESLTESLSDLQPAAPEVVLPLAPTPIPVPAAVKHQEKDGHYFLDVSSLFAFSFIFLILCAPH